MTEKEFKIKVLPLSTAVYPLALRLLQSEELARDAVQLSMMKLWENRKKLDKCESIKAFVFRVVRNTCLDELKKKKPFYIENSESIAHLRADKGFDHDSHEAVLLIKSIIETLPDNQREVIQMRDIDELEFVEIAKILNKDMPYLRVLLSRARKTVKKKLTKIYEYEAIAK